MIVLNEAELKEAIKRKEKNIEIYEKELCDKVIKTNKLKKFSKATLALVITAIIGGTILIPITGGGSLIGGMTIATVTFTAKELTTLIWLVGLLGLAAIGLIKGYNVEVTTEGVKMTKK